MPANYENGWSNVTGDLIPEWFYSLSAEDRNIITAASYAEYVSLTEAKNVVYATYFANLIAPYNPDP